MASTCFVKCENFFNYFGWMKKEGYCSSNTEPDTVSEYVQCMYHHGVMNANFNVMRSQHSIYTNFLLMNAIILYCDFSSYLNFISNCIVGVLRGIFLKRLSAYSSISFRFKTLTYLILKQFYCHRVSNGWMRLGICRSIRCYESRDC